MIRFILLVFLVFGTSHSTAQKKNTQAEIDSFALNKLNSENLEDFRKLLEVDNKFYGWSRYYANKAYMLYKKNKTDSAKRYADSALSNFTRLKKKYFLDEESLLKAYMTLGYIYRNEEQYEASTTNFLNALEIERKYPYPYKSYIVGAIANNHLSLGNNERAINLYQQNLKDSLYISFPRPHVVTLTRLGVLYSKNYLNHKDSAYHYFKKAENISLATNYLDNLPVIYSNLGLLFKSTHVDSTLHYFKKSKIQFESFELPENISKHHFNIEQSVFNSFVDIHEKKYTKAIKNLKTCIDILKLKANDKNDRDVLVAAYEYLILAYEKTDQLKKANACLKEKEKFMVQFHQEELKIEIAKIETAFETKEKEEHIRKLELKNRAKDLEVTQKQTQLVAGSLIALAILLLALIFFRQRIFKNRFEKISLEQRLLRSQMNPHFIYNVLQNAISLIDKQPKEAKGFIANFGQLLRLNLENSREDFVFLEDELKALKGYLELSSALTKKFFHTIAVDPDIDPAATKIPPMLIQPLVENAIKHGINGIAEEGKIKVSLSKKTKTLLHCNICDNGKGFSPMQGKPSNQHRSLSLNILQERLHMYVKNKKNAMVTIEHPNAKGKNMSCVGINIPFQEI